MPPADLALDLLVFRTGEARFGLDAEQIARVVDLPGLEATGDGGDGPVRVLVGRDELPLVALGSPGDDEAQLREPATKLVVPKGTPPPVAFAIGDLEEMVRVEADQIGRLPPLVRSMVEGSGMWAAARCETGLVILIDLDEAAEAAVRPPGSA
jgi:chemotaxis signal transduction protein